MSLLPSEIHIHDQGGHLETYSITRRRSFAVGSIRFREKGETPLITIQDDLLSWQSEETFLHEVVHACEKEAQKAGEAGHIPEAWVEAISRRLYWTLRANGFWKTVCEQPELIECPPVSYWRRALEAEYVVSRTQELLNSLNPKDRE